MQEDMEQDEEYYMDADNVLATLDSDDKETFLHATTTNSGMIFMCHPGCFTDLGIYN